MHTTTTEGCLTKYPFIIMSNYNILQLRAKELPEFKAGDTVCIIEAMKLLNEIEAETDGVIQEILVENGAPVEFGQPLFILE